MGDEILQRKLNASPKDRFFANLRQLQRYIGEVTDDFLRMKMEKSIEGALSWEPLIDDGVGDEKVTQNRACQHSA